MKKNFLRILSLLLCLSMLLSVVPGAFAAEETETVQPCTEHIWDDGLGSETQITYTCTLCGETRAEALTEAGMDDAAEPCADEAHIWNEGVAAGDGILFTCAVCGMTREEAAAEETAAPTEETIPVTDHEEPLRAEPYQAKADATESMRLPQHHEEAVRSEIRPLADEPTFTSKAAAAAYFRSQMAARETEIIFTYEGSDFDPKTLPYEISGMAFEHTGEPTEGDYLRWHYDGWNGKVTYSSNWATLTYSVGYYTTKAQEAALDTAVAGVLAGLDLEGKSDYQKVRAIYDYVCENVTYDYANLSDGSYKLKYTAYAALMNKTAVCQGYALLMYRLLLEEGIDCRLISGYGNGGRHGWNIVRLEGKYYNLDSTWDAGRSQYGYFLKSDGGFGDHVRDDEFAASDFCRAYPMGSSDYRIPQPVIVYDDNGICYSVFEGTATVVGYTGSPEEVVIQASINGCPVTAIEDSAFSLCASLVSLTLPAEVSAIGDSAFRYCSSLKDVYYAGSEGDKAKLAIGSLNDPLKNARWHFPEEPVSCPVYRLYNPFTLEHLFVSSESEYDSLGSAGWVRESVAWYAPEEGVPVYRLYNAYTDGHFYTVSETEKDRCIANGWAFDGVVSHGADPGEGLPIYRMFNPFEEKNYHHYTASESERDALVSAGWVYEGVAWYAASQ